MISRRRALGALLAVAAAGCAAPRSAVPVATAATPAAVRRADGDIGRGLLAGTRQLVLVTTASYDTTGGELRRYERDTDGSPWRAVGSAIPVVVGRTGLAWDDRFDAPAGTPVKREGDGRAPAGIFALDTVFGFPPASEAGWVRLPYLPLTAGSECVDDVASSHYNTIVDRATTARVDWNSAEPMRRIDQYRLGVTVAYNAAPPRAGRGSCIFLHIWAGPDTYTAGCTAMAERDLTALVLWMDRARAPHLAQLPVAEYARVREAWGLP